MDRSLVVLSGMLALCGFLIVTSFTTAAARQELDQPRKAELVSLIGERGALVDDLDAAVEQLRAEVAAAQAVVAQRNSAAEGLTEEVRRLSLQAGATPVHGPGLVVELDNSDRTPASPADAGAYRIHDTDLQQVVNALFLAGGEAVAINGSRVVATTAIRAAGDAIVVNFRPLSPPFQVTAIGADRRAFERTTIAGRFRRWSQVFGLAYKVSVQEDLRLPAYTGRVRIQAAEPVGDP